ncbi:MAG TPA: hypothetical protein VFD43_12420 [Planctomycetota bacterium]|nr:hypothetical protein [Planctomycetota bacterium]
MITKAKYYGGGINHSSFVGTGPLDPRAARCWRVAAGGVGVLPDARELKGGERLYLWNADGASDFDVTDNAAGAVVTLAAGEVALIVCADNSTQAGEWRAIPLSFL